MMSLWDAPRMNMMISYQELVRTFLSRLFRQETGKSPAKAIEGLRLEAARLMIEQSHLSLDSIARESGFRDGRHMREVFIRGYGIPPQSLRSGR